MIKTIDQNDLAYVIERFGKPRKFLASPLSIYKIGEHKGKKKINPHVSSFLMKDGRTVSVFHSKPIYYMHIDGSWRPLSEVTVHHGNRNLTFNEKWEQIEPWYLRWLMKRCELIGGSVAIPYRFGSIPIREGREVYFTVTTVYPDPDPETTTVDGKVGVFISGGDTWANIIAAAGTTATPSGNPGLFSRGAAAATSNTWQNVDRAIYLFDTSSIPDTDSVSAATFSLYVTAKDTTIAVNYNVVASTPASNTNLVNGDYNQLGSTKFSTAIAGSSITTSAYNDWALNGSGQSAVSKTGVSKFGSKLEEDIDASSPTWSSNVEGSATCNYAEAAGTTNDPKLAVTHAEAPVGAMSYFMGSGFWGA